MTRTPYTHAVANSGNSKLGPGWGCTYRPVGLTCPPSCPFLGRGCYAQSGRVNIYQRRIDPAGGFLTHLDGCARVRWEVSGDALRGGKLDRPYHRAKLAWHRRNPSGVSLGFTHAPAAFEAAGAGPATWPRGFHLLASVHSKQAASYWQARGWRTARVVKKRDRLCRGERLCPVDLDKHEGRAPTTNCAKCGLCWASSCNVVFLEF